MAERLNRKVDISDKFVVFPPWPLEDHVEPVEHHDNPFRKEQELAGKTVIMYSGNLSIASPVDTILEVAKRVTDVPELLFLFIGGGLVKKQIDELIAREKSAEHSHAPLPADGEASIFSQCCRRAFGGRGRKDCRHLSSLQDLWLDGCGTARALLGSGQCHASDILAYGDIGWAIEHGNVDEAEQVIREIYADQRDTPHGDGPSRSWDGRSTIQQALSVRTIR